MTDYWVGGYTRPDEGGVRLLEPGASGTVVVAETPDPSYLLPSPDHAGLLYAVDEGGNAVVAIRTDGTRAEVVATVPTAGSAPCHLAIVSDGSMLLAACYADGVVSAHALDADGLPSAGVPLPAADPAPNGPHPAQDGPHAHCSLEVGGLVLIADLGTDRVLLYRRRDDGFAFDGAIRVAAGAGPRDLLLLPSGTVLLLGEHDARVHVLDLEARTVRTSVATTVDPTSKDQASGMTLDGDRLTAGLRGSDRIAVLRVGADGVPAPVSSTPTGGSWPRHHVLDGDRVLVANERSGTVTVLPVDPGGGLGSAVETIATPAPTFLSRVQGQR